MAGTVVAVFKDRLQAEKGAQALLDAGVPLKNIALHNKDIGRAKRAAHDATQAPDDDEAMIVSTANPIESKQGVVWLGLTWGFMGGSFGCLTLNMMVYFDSAHRFIIQQPLWTQVVFTGIGGVIGYIIGVVSANTGPQKESSALSEHVERGHTVVTVVAASANAERYEALLSARGGQELEYVNKVLETLQTA